MPAAPVPYALLQARVGSEIGVSPWIAILQDRIACFAEATDDYSEVHLDPALAQSWGFADTFAQGFLTLSMLMKLQEEVVPPPEGMKSGFNYGFDKLRFLEPVMTGARIRGRFTLTALDEVRPGHWRRNVAVVVEIEGRDKPAIVADWLAHFVVASS